MLKDAVGKTIESITSDSGPSKDYPQGIASFVKLTFTDGTTVTFVAEASDPFAMPFLVEEVE